MKILLNQKHWILFLILFSFAFLSMVLPETNITIANFNSLETSLIFRIIAIVIFFIWLLVLGINLNSKIENPYHFSNIVFILAIIFSASNYVIMNLEMLFNDSNLIPTFLDFILLPFAFWGIVYTFYKVPKSLKSIELGRTVKYSECIIDALLLFFFPIGIWFIQPKINQIFKTKNDKN